MGLDFVEVLTDVEEHFGVTIETERAFEVRTVGDLLDLVEARVERRETAGCLSLPWFLKLRRLTRETTQLPQLRLRPATKVVGALRPRDRKPMWRGLRRYFGASLRRLRRPKPIRAAIVLTAFSALILLLLGSWSENLMFAALPCAVLALSLFIGSRPLKVVPPVGYETFGEITQRLVSLEAIATGYPTKAGDMIFAELALIVSEQLGVDLKDVTPDARFVEDLGMY